MTVNIHGKEYVTVAERLEAAQEAIRTIITEVVQFSPVIIVKALVRLKDGREATGLSGANPEKTIEKNSPVEVAETSAVGRALGFLGFGVIDGIATADEMFKAGIATAPVKPVQPSAVPGTAPASLARINTTPGAPCPECHSPYGKPHATNCPTLKG